MTVPTADPWAAHRIVELSERIAQYAAIPSDGKMPRDANDAVKDLLTALEFGEVRAALRDEVGRWTAVQWVKQGILLAFRIGKLTDMSVRGDAGLSGISFVDKGTVPVRTFGVNENIRLVPGGSSIRRGTYVAPGVVCMPPMYINIGAYVDSGTMVDSHALIGSCAQIGKNVHVSAAAQIGGVLEPINAAPVIVEDGAMVGGNCGVYEGTVVRARAVLAAGVILTRATPVFDLVRETVYRGSADEPLEIPEGAVVVPGARAVRSEWGAENQLSVQAPVIVKYRDEKTDMATALEGWLR